MTAFATILCVACYKSKSEPLMIYLSLALLLLKVQLRHHFRVECCSVESTSACYAVRLYIKLFLVWIWSKEF